MHNKRSSIVIFLCLIISAIFTLIFSVQYALAEESEDWTLTIHRVGANESPNDSNRCATYTSPIMFDLKFESKNFSQEGGGSLETYRHNPDDNNKVFGHGSNTNGLVVESVKSESVTDVDQSLPCSAEFNDGLFNYYLTLSKGEENYTHEIQDGMRSMSIDLEKGEIEYYDYDSSLMSAESKFWNFGNGEINQNNNQGIVQTLTNDNLKYIHFSATGDPGGLTYCDDDIFEEGYTHFTVTFARSDNTIVHDYIPNANTQTEMFIKSAGGEETTCHLWSNNAGHTITVSTEDENNSDSFSIPFVGDTGPLQSFNIDISLDENNHIIVTTSHAVNSAGTNEISPDDTVLSERPQADPTCQSSGAAGGLGWIVCPALKWAAKASANIYTDYVKPSLELKPELFKTANDSDQKSTVEEIWEIIRNIANVFFVGFLLFIIFSQLTGVGIDNYGIKKSLPKLIAVAIIVNLSFVICQATVDLSNILGNGLQSLFNGFSNSLTIPEGIPIQTNQATKDSSGRDEAVADIRGASADANGPGGIITAIVIFAGVFAIIGVICNPGILFTLLIAVLGLVVSILYLFVLLSARQAAVILLTIISPLAFACLILPNTKKLFDRWLKIWQTLLLLYPICGLVVAGGNYVSKLFLAIGMANTGFFGALTAMIAGIIPIFFIPKLVKSSFAAIGSIGAAISGYGARLSGRTTKALKNSEVNKNIQKASAEHRIKFKAGYSEKNGLNKLGKLKASIANGTTQKGGKHKKRFFKALGKVAKTTGWAKSQQKYIAQAEELAEKHEKQLANADTAIRQHDDAANPAKRADNVENVKEMIESNLEDPQSLLASIDSAVDSGQVKDKDLAKIVRDLLNNGQLDKLEKDGSLRTVLEKLNQKYGNGFLATDLELADFVRSGGTKNGGRLGDYGEYAAKGNIKLDDIKPQDLTRLSGNSIAALAEQGKITAAMAKRVLEMNPNISEDKKIMFGALAQGSNGGTTSEIIKQNGGYKQFVADAKSLTNPYNRGANVGTIRTNGNSAMVESWASTTPVRAHIRN